jgi:hypothetical protein
VVTIVSEELITSIFRARKTEAHKEGYTSSDTLVPTHKATGRQVTAHKTTTDTFVFLVYSVFSSHVLVLAPTDLLLNGYQELTTKVVQ